jgi:hypothetical protein
MRFFFTIALIVGCLVVHTQAFPHQRRSHKSNQPIEYEPDEGYRRRKDSDEIQKTMFDYLTQPKVLNELPAAMKDQMVKYIKNHPEYELYKNSESSTKSEDSGSICIIQ